MEPIYDIWNLRPDIKDHNFYIILKDVDEMDILTDALGWRFEVSFSIDGMTPPGKITAWMRAAELKDQAHFKWYSNSRGPEEWGLAAWARIVAIPEEEAGLATVKIARKLDFPTLPEPDYDLECPVCGYKKVWQTIVDAFCGINDDGDVFEFCSRCCTRKMKELGVPEMRPIPKEAP